VQELLKDKVAAVTGGGRGIGYGIAEVFAKNGAHIAILDVDHGAAGNAAQQLSQYGIACRAYGIDVSEVHSIGSTIDQIEKDFGRIDIWVNNAGRSQNVQIEDLSERDWDQILDTNLKGLVFCCKEVLARMKPFNNGRIINIASLSGQRGGHFAGVHYSSSKGGVITATKCFALYGAPYNINVNAIAPGLICTRMAEELGFAQSVGDIPLGRIGTIEDVAKVALFLASDLADYVTGQTISVNGGMYMA